MVDDVFETDVLIVGGGGAGARAAIEAKEMNVEVLIAVKGLFGRSGCTVMAEGGYNAALGFIDRVDNPAIHFEDTIIGGRFLNNQKLVEILVKEAPQRLFDLERFGAVFDRINEDKLDQRAFGGHRYRRTCYKGDKTGHEMMNALKEECMKRGVEVLEEVSITSLLTSKGKVCGATGLDILNSDFLLFKAKTVVLATGGAGQVYYTTTNPFQKTGDGFALAYNAGAELINMEMVQFHPTGMVHPRSARGLLVTEGVRGEGGKLYNAEGERFMKKYDPEKMELSTRDVVTRAIYTEIKEGRGTDRGGVFLDVSHLPDEIIEDKLAMMSKQFLDVGVDIGKEPMEVAPSAHHFMGGVRTNERCESTVENLYACGEVNGGLHGANRLGGNSLAETQVFGARAGQYASQKALKMKFLPVDERQVEKEHERIFRFEEGGEVLPYEVRSALQKVMWDNVGIIRHENGLKTALKEIKKLALLVNKISVQKERRYNLQLLQAVEIENMLCIAEMIIRDALARKESRGAHFRSDYPHEDKKWLKNIAVRKGAKRTEIKIYPCVITALKP